MVFEAETTVRAANSSVVRVIRVTGCYEVPFVADRELASDDVSALIVLGYIERGETLHGEVMGHVVQRILVDLQLKYNEPM